MAEKKHSIVSRRMLLGTLAGGATAATALAATRASDGGTITQTFTNAFTSPFFSLSTADHTAWTAEIGKSLQVENGPSLLITGVETFASYGTTDEDLIRPRAFLVNMNVTGRGRLTGNTIQRVTHKRYGSFDLYLITTPALPTFAQAVFN